ncbi:MAG: phosphoglycerate dehydrogenase [Deltaproteobacteria bacterium]|nr:phosphoglycerate dehydrogenase [Deltaproteobacteria bacterium]
MTYRVLVSDKLSERGLAILRAAEGIETDVKVGLSPADLAAAIGAYDALIVRSATKVTAPVLKAGSRLKVVGRAGIGVDNVDVQAASRNGVVVMNTPDGNVVTTAEHAIALMCALTRWIPQATASMRTGGWEKTKFQGRELFHKTLGILGLGNIGKIVADRALGLRMKVIAYDPFVTPERAREIGVELVGLDELLRRSDYLSLHVPLLESTKNIIDRAAIEKMKPGAFLIDAARGGLVDEQAVADAVKSGRLGGAAFDVFATEPPAKDNPLLGVDKIILTPHLGASTDEAQENVSIAVAEQVVDFLRTGAVKNAVNAPSVSPEHMATVGPYLRLAARIGSFAGQVHDGGIRKIKVAYHGNTANMPTASITIAILKGLISTMLEQPVNEVNAPLIAKDRGIEWTEEKTHSTRDFAGAIAVEIEGDQGKTEVMGALLGPDEPRIVRLDGMRLELVPQGTIILTRHIDRPGMLGKIGTVLGDRGINISRLVLASPSAGTAQASISIDGPCGQDVVDTLSAIQGVERVRVVTLA